MTVSDLCEKCGFKAVSLPSGDREVKGSYIGDLLSWVMGRAESDQVWITIMSNVNIVAVASLTDVSAVILSEGVSLDESVVSTAIQKNVNILISDKSSYETALAISKYV